MTMALAILLLVVWLMATTYYAVRTIHGLEARSEGHRLVLMYLVPFVPSRHLTPEGQRFRRRLLLSFAVGIVSLWLAGREVWGCHAGYAGPRAGVHCHALWDTGHEH